MYAVMHIIEQWAHDNSIDVSTDTIHDLAKALADADLIKTEFEKEELERLFNLKTAVDRGIRKGWINEEDFDEFL